MRKKILFFILAAFTTQLFFLFSPVIYADDKSSEPEAVLSNFGVYLEIDGGGYKEAALELCQTGILNEESAGKYDDALFAVKMGREWFFDLIAPHAIVFSPSRIELVLVCMYDKKHFEWKNENGLVYKKRDQYLGDDVSISFPAKSVLNEDKLVIKVPKIDGKSAIINLLVSEGTTIIMQLAKSRETQITGRRPYFVLWSKSTIENLQHYDLHVIIKDANGQNVAEWTNDAGIATHQYLRDLE